MVGRRITIAGAPAWALLIALAAGLPAGTAAALPSVVSADQEAERANPGRRARPLVADADLQARLELRAALDRAFGPGRWRKTSGFRTVAQENGLRRLGAGTVAPGRISRHSTGSPDRPGAYDVVVDGLSQESAAERLRRAGGGAFRVMAEGAHGSQGPHLHIELVSARGPALAAAGAGSAAEN